MSYRVLLVDDDSIVRMGLKMAVNWQELGFEIIGEASNGEEALDMMEKLQPDVVLTDMYMPKYDGIKLMQEAKERLLKAKFIVLSCYSDFEYVKSSLKLGASDYLLKSTIVHSEELSLALKNVKETLEKSDRDEVEIKGLKDKLELSLPAFRKQFLLDLLKGRIQNEQVLLQGINELKYDLASQNFFLIVLELDDYTSRIEQYGSVESLDSTVLNILQEITLQYGPAEFFCISQNMYGTLIDIPAKSLIYSPYDRALSIAESIRMSLKQYKEMTGILYLDKGVSISELPASFERINKTVCYRTFAQHDSIIRVTETTSDEQVSSEIPLFSQMLEVFYDAHRFEKYIKDSFRLITPTNFMASFKNTSTNLVNIYNKISKELCGYSLNQKEKFLNESDLMEIEKIHNGQEWIIKKFAQLRDEVIQAQNDTSKKLVHEISEYINNNYQNNITLDDLAKTTNFNKYYICKKFKKETGTNIMNYIMEMRINKAKELLLKGDDRIYKVAQSVGFNDTSYFSLIFKKITGKTPKEFVELNKAVGRHQSKT
jgi:two-component system response regulator YesN